jgi:F-box and WD-40 domain protein MET30
MLQGILSQLCFPQLSLVSREVSEALKIDFITALPVELSQKILCYLDTVSLTKAAQVSQRWRQLADDDAVWVRMCEQHVNRKCTKCGWGLPLLERKKLRYYTRQRQLAKSNSNGRIQELDDSYNAAQNGIAPPSGKRPYAGFLDDAPDGKRPRVDRANGANSSFGSTDHKQHEGPKKSLPWKLVYRDRWQVSAHPVTDMSTHTQLTSWLDRI